jgi:glycosyltransferase involved in cell wall biosynthesis
MSKPKFSVVVPCYNEEKAILATIQALRASLTEAGPYELIAVNDGSTDGSGEILRQAQNEDATLRVVHHERNLGYGAALKAGIRRAVSGLIVITDADGTYPPDCIQKLVETAEDADMVVGARTSDNVTYPFIRKIPKIFLANYVSWLAGKRIPDMNSGMRVFRKSVVERFMNILPNGFSFTTTITLSMVRNHYDVRFIPISYASRVGKSKIQPIRDTLRFTQLIIRTGMYFAPLRVLTPIILLLMLGFGGSLFYDVFVLRNLTDKTVILLLFALNTALFALLADMIDKRSTS